MSTATKLLKVLVTPLIEMAFMDLRSFCWIDILANSSQGPFEWVFFVGRDVLFVQEFSQYFLLKLSKALDAPLTDTLKWDFVARSED